MFGFRPNETSGLLTLDTESIAVAIELDVRPLISALGAGKGAFLERKRACLQMIRAHGTDIVRAQVDHKRMFQCREVGVSPSGAIETSARFASVVSVSDVDRLPQSGAISTSARFASVVSVSDVLV